MIKIAGDVLHPGDDELVQLMDRELPAENRVALLDHVAGCRECQERLDELESASGWLRQHVAALDAGIPVDEIARARALGALRIAARSAQESPRSLASSRLLRAATIAGLVVFGGISVPPLAAWIGNRIGVLRPEVEALSPAASVAATDIAGTTGPTVSFPLNDAAFRVEFAHPQTGGELTLVRSASGLASAQILNGRDEVIVVLPTGLRIENNAGSTASYRVVLPESMIERFEIEAGGEWLAAGTLQGSGTTSVQLAEPASLK